MLIRSFVAIEIPPPLREKVVQVQEILRGAGGGVKWVEPENLHLTLRFLGEVEEDRLKAVEGVCRQVAAASQPFHLELVGVGAFPHARAPRVVWMGVGEGSEALAELAARLERGIRALGFSREERPFRPHLTLGRVRRPEAIRSLVEALASLGQERVGAMRVEEMVLMRSDLTPGGPLYTPLSRFPLGAMTEEGRRKGRKKDELGG